MNNIFLNNDPLLCSQQDDRYNMYRLQLYNLQLFNDILYGLHDYISELDDLLTGLDQDVINSLNQDEEWNTLNTLLLAIIKSEIINLIKGKLNINQNVITNVNKQKDIIKLHITKLKTTEKQNMAELNDYMKNYSHLTFDEYKKIKNEQK